MNQNGSYGGGPNARNKPKQKSAFMFFVEDFKAQQSSMGKSYTKLADAVRDAGPIWKDLPESEKGKYTMKSKGHRGGEKYNALGEKLSDVTKRIEENKRAVELEEATMERYIDQAFRENRLLEKFFCIISTNYYCVTNNRQYVTCEVAVAMFSLKEGVHTTYSTLVHVDIPMGYAWDAREKSNTIGIDMPPIRESCRDYLRIYTSLYGICNESDSNYDAKLPPFYCLPSEIPAVTDFLQQISDDADTTNQFRVYPLDMLFFKIRSKLAIVAEDTGLIRQTLALNELLVDKFQYSVGISCEYHSKKELYHKCSLSVVNRMAFVICDHCCKPANINVILGKHLPNDLQLKPSALQIKKEEIKSEDSRSVAGKKENPWEEVEKSKRTKSWSSVPSVSSSSRMSEDPSFSSLPKLGRGRGRHY